MGAKLHATPDEDLGAPRTMISKFVGGVHCTKEASRIDEPCSMASIRNPVPVGLTSGEHLNIVHDQDAQFERYRTLMQGQFYNYQINSNGGQLMPISPAAKAVNPEITSF